MAPLTAAPPAPPGDDRIDVAPATVRRLIAAQFPHCRDLPLAPAPVAGWDNRTFRLGAEMKVRLPSAARYAAQAPKEHLWLSRLAPHLPVAIPRSLGLGAPGPNFPWPWSVQSWLPGTTAAAWSARDRSRLAADVAAFLRALWAAPAMGGPAAGPHSFHRGGALAVYGAETRASLAVLALQPREAAAAALWRAACAAPFAGPPVWVHVDMAPGNLLVDADRLAAVMTSASAPSGTPPAISRSPGPSSTALRARPSAIPSPPIPRPGRGRAAGRSGRRCSSRRAARRRPLANVRRVR